MAADIPAFDTLQAGAARRAGLDLPAAETPTPVQRHLNQHEQLPTHTHPDPTASHRPGRSARDRFHPLHRRPHGHHDPGRCRCRRHQDRETQGRRPALFRALRSQPGRAGRQLPLGEPQQAQHHTGPQDRCRPRHCAGAGARCRCRGGELHLARDGAVRAGLRDAFARQPGPDLLLGFGVRPHRRAGRPRRLRHHHAGRERLHVAHWLRRSGRCANRPGGDGHGMRHDGEQRDPDCPGRTPPHRPGPACRCAAVRHRGAHDRLHDRAIPLQRQGAQAQRQREQRRGAQRCVPHGRPAALSSTSTDRCFAGSSSTC